MTTYDIHRSNVFFIYGAVATAIEYWKRGAEAESLLRDLEKFIEADKDGIDLVATLGTLDIEKF